MKMGILSDYIVPFFFETDINKGTYLVWKLEDD